MDKSIIIKWIFYFIGNLFMGSGIALSYYANLGTDPLSMFCDGVHKILSISYGSALLILNISFLAILIIFGRKFIRIGLVISCILPGIIIDIFTKIYSIILPCSSLLIIRIIFLLVGIIITCFGLGIYLSAGIGAAPSDSIHLLIIEKFNIKYKHVRIISDIFFGICGFLLGGVVGLGTILSLLLFGIIVDFIRLKSINLLMKL